MRICLKWLHIHASLILSSNATFHQVMQLPPLLLSPLRINQPDELTGLHINQSSAKLAGNLRRMDTPSKQNDFDSLHKSNAS